MKNEKISLQNFITVCNYRITAVSQTQQNCASRTSFQNFVTEFPYRISLQNFLTEFPYRISLQNFLTDAGVRRDVGIRTFAEVNEAGYFESRRKLNIRVEFRAADTLLHHNLYTS
jgi:hypothetical protein